MKKNSFAGRRWQNLAAGSCYLTAADGHADIGFITPMSSRFCATCDRACLAVDGILYLCLAEKF